MGGLTRARYGATLALLFMGLFVAAHADAQRRRSRRAPKPPTTQAAEPAEAAEDPKASPVSGEKEAPVPAPSGKDEEAPETSPAVDDSRSAEGPSVKPPDIGPLREELATVMDDLVQARSRMAVLGQQLFRTRVRITVHNRSTRRQNLTELVVSLDGAPVFRSDGGEVSEPRTVFDGFAAPGPHELILEIAQRGRESDEFRYSKRDRYRFEVIGNKLTDITVWIDDKSTMASRFSRREKGEYDARMRVFVETRKLGGS